jgi:glutamyl-tRNA synthetase
VRFRTPTSGTVDWDDLVRGQASVRNDDLEDPVLVRSSGEPTFYLASTVDDIDDRVTHMLRPDITMRMTAAQIHLWHALRGEPRPYPVTSL